MQSNLWCMYLSADQYTDRYADTDLWRCVSICTCIDCCRSICRMLCKNTEQSAVHVSISRSISRSIWICSQIDLCRCVLISADTDLCILCRLSCNKYRSAGISISADWYADWYSAIQRLICVHINTQINILRIDLYICLLVCRSIRRDRYTEIEIKISLHMCIDISAVFSAIWYIQFITLYGSLCTTRMLYELNYVHLMISSSMIMKAFELNHTYHIEHCCW